MSKPPTYVYRYEVTMSDYEPVPVGTLLVDARRDLVKVWTIRDGETGKMFEFVGQRRERMCSDCWVLRKGANEDGHDGPHGAVPIETLGVIRETATA